MRFGGHQTFYVREGWLAKGLALLLDDASAFDDPFVADQLGVGRNMAKSIEHWMLATGLATKGERRRRPDRPRLKATELGKIIAKHDPWFLDPGTWWFLHINLVRTPAHAATWHWFFNHYASSRFERATVVAQLEQHERLRSQRVSSSKTLERDVSCFLGSYAVEVPYRRKDPEEEIDCPFQELRIIRHFRASGYYELNRRRKSISPQVLLYALQAPGLTFDARTGMVDVTLHDLHRMEGGPAQVLALSADEVPYRRKDPEEEIDCPFQELRIIRHFRASGYYELNRRRKSISPQVLLYALQAPGLTFDARTGMVDVTLHDLHRMEGGPAQVLALSADALFEHLVDLETNSGDAPLSMSGLAGDRQLRYEFVPAPELVARNFDRATAESAYV